MELKDLKIDPEFEEKIPPLSKEELELLEQNILTDGRVIDPLIIWNGTIVDGHNRYRILMKHPEIPFSTFSKDFSDKNEAVVWICNNQLGKRNLTFEQRRYLIGKRYEAEKKSHGGNCTGRDAETGKFLKSQTNGPSERTSERIAAETNTSKSYVESAERYARGVDAAEEAIPGLRNEILTGGIRAKRDEIAAIAQSPPEDRPSLIEQLRRGESIKVGVPDFENTDDLEEVLQVQAPKRKEILELAESMNHSKGQALGTIEDMIYEMNSALEDMIIRWNFCKQVYPKHIRSRNGKKLIKLLAKEGMDYLTEIRRGLLWKDAQTNERGEER